MLLSICSWMLALDCYVTHCQFSPFSQCYQHPPFTDRVSRPVIPELPTGRQRQKSSSLDQLVMVCQYMPEARLQCNQFLMCFTRVLITPNPGHTQNPKEPWTTEGAPPVHLTAHKTHFQSQAEAVRWNFRPSKSFIQRGKRISHVSISLLLHLQFCQVTPTFSLPTHVAALGSVRNIPGPVEATTQATAVYDGNVVLFMW